MILIPNIPDIQITRPKLLVIEVGFLTLLFIYLLLFIFRGETQIKKSPLNIVLISMLGMYLLSFLASREKSVSIFELRRLLICLCVYFVFANFYEYKQRKYVLLCWLLGTSLSALYGILQRTGGFWIIQVPKLHRVMSFFGNPIFFASHLTISIPIFFGLMLSFKKFLKYLFIIPILCCLFALYLTETRAAWIGISISAFVFILHTIKIKKMKLALIPLFILCVSAIFYIRRDVWLRQQAHLLIWRDTLNMWIRNPFFGTGIGTFHIYFPDYASKELRTIWPQKQFIINDAHNEYIQILSETGIFGFGIFIWFLVTFFTVIKELREKMVIHTSKDKLAKKTTVNYDKGDKYLIAGITSGIVGLLIQNIFSVDMRFTISSVYLFIAVGIISSYLPHSWIVRNKLRLSHKYIALIFLILSFGFLSFSWKKDMFNLHLLNFIHIRIPELSIKTGISDDGIGLSSFVLRPYLAHKRVASKIDFFDEKILEPLKTIEELKKVSEKYPNEAKIYEKLAWVYAKEKKFKEAILCYEKAISLNPNIPGPYNNLGNIYFLLGNRQTAIKYYEKSIDVAPEQIDARLNLGKLYYLEGMLKEASAHFNKVLQIDPRNEEAIVMLKRMRE